MRPQTKLIWGAVLGMGTTLGNGCTSGHGLCGLSRFSIRSLVAVPTFMVAAILSSTVSQIVESDGAFAVSLPAPPAMIAPKTIAVAGVAAGILGVALIPLLVSRRKVALGEPIALSLAGVWCGLSSGVGLAVGGMVRISGVRAALSPQRFDFSLWTLFATALVTTCAIYTIAYKALGIDQARVQATDNKKVDRQLIIGAALFGLGWGVTGACPGPLIVVVAAQPESPANLLVLLGVIIGTQLGSSKRVARLVTAPCSSAPCAPADVPATATADSADSAVSVVSAASPPPSPPAIEEGATATAPSAAAPFPTADELVSILGAGAPVVELREPTSADANEAGEFVTIGGALSAPWDRAAGTLPLGALPADKDAPLILTCRSGSRAAKAATVLRDAGYTAVVNGGGPQGPPELWAALAGARGLNVRPLGGFLQLFDGPAPDGGGSSTLTYVLYDLASKEAIIIDPVIEQVERDLAAVAETGCRLVLALNTHCHADHITGTGLLKQRVPGLQSAISASSGAKADRHLSDNEVVTWADGRRALKVLATPGHTNGCISLHDETIGAVFTGDTILIGGCGRTDFQEGSSETLHRSVHARLFPLPAETLVYPAHDYKGRRFSTIGLEKTTNPRLSKPLVDFVALMEALTLPYPKKIEASLPANLLCGIQDAA